MSYVTGHRMNAKRGVECSQAKLTDDDVRLIRELWAYKQREKAKLERDLSIAAIAAKFDVSVRAIERVLNRETWSHVR